MVEKLCINCIHYADSFLFKHYREVFCINEKLDTGEKNVVDGSMVKIKEKCLDVRLDESLCGWTGNWWEPRSPKISEKTETKGIAAPSTTSSRRKQPTLEDLM